MCSSDLDLDVTVRLTQDTPGLVGMEVEVDAPEANLSQLVVVFTAPPNPDVGTITQPIPLTGQGVAVRLAENGLPLTVAGTWQVQISAVTAAGVVAPDPQTFVIRNDDGSSPTTDLTVPPVVIETTVAPAPATTTG